MAEKGRNLGWIAALAALVLYWPTGEHAFITFDDPLYLYENSRLADGLSLESIAWAFSATELGNWHPLTWLSHLLDVSLFGMEPGAHHRVNGLLHAISVLLLFGWLRRASGRAWPAFFVALLWATHPLHVESIAWASERKDVLSLLFANGAIWAYVARRPMAIVALLHAASLMAKPTLVTLPLLLLVIDYWPLARLARERVVEKWPLFLLTFGSAVTTFLVQRAGGAVRTLDSFPLVDRLLNALMTLWVYPRQALVPIDLAFFYPYPEISGSWPAIAIAAALTVGVSLLAWRSRRWNPVILAGWLWYLIALVPVIGIVQVGSQAHADRYAYLPLIGLYIAATWSIDRVVPTTKQARIALGVVAFVVLALFGVRSTEQIATWRDSETLYRHALAVTEGNYVAHDALGYALREAGRDAEAIEQYEAVLAIRPDFSTSLNNLGVLRSRGGRLAEAIELYRRAIESDPDYGAAHNNLGIALAQSGQLDEAGDHLARSIEFDPENAEALYNLGLIRRSEGRTAQMLDLFLRAEALRPDWHEMAIEAVWVLAGSSDPSLRDGDEALRLAEAAVTHAPNNPYWISALAAAYAELGRFNEAVATQERANALLGERTPASLIDRLDAYRAGRPFRS